MSEHLLIAIFSVVGVAIGACFGLIVSHIRQCGKTAGERSDQRAATARVEGYIEAVKEELAAHRQWRDVAFPARMDGFLSDIYGDASNRQRDMQREVDSLRHEIEKLRGRE